MICIYEDDEVARLSPLCDLRPTCDILCGRLTLLEKLRRFYPTTEFNLWLRDELAEIAAENHPDCYVNKPVTNCRLWLSARAILDEPISPYGRNAVLLCDDYVVGFRIGAEHAKQLARNAVLRAELPEEQVRARLMQWPWDIIERNAAELRRELGNQNQKAATSTRRLPKGVTLVGPRSKLHLAETAELWPGAVISTATGPVFVDRLAVIRPGSFVEGPCYIGPGTVIDGAQVRPGCSFGPQCRIGGEVESSVFQGYSNKHHSGFIGHSFVGEWVNLGALTTNSDLKNSYQPVSVFFDGKPIDSGLLKVGCFIGDHAKTAIGTLLNTGTRVGTFANWFESGLSPKEIPAFAWGTKARWPIAVAIENARQVMSRRGVKMSQAYERALRVLFQKQTRPNTPSGTRSPT